MLAVHESKARSLALENQRLTKENELCRERIKRLWSRIHGGVEEAGAKVTDGSAAADDRSVVRTIGNKKAKTATAPSSSPSAAV